MRYSLMVIFLFHTWLPACLCFGNKEAQPKSPNALSGSPTSLTVINEHAPHTSLSDALSLAQKEHEIFMLYRPTPQLPQKRIPITVDQITNDLQHYHYTFLLAAVWAKKVPNLNKQDRLGRLALVIAVQHKDDALADFLTQLGADWDRQDAQGNSAKKIQEKLKAKKETLFTANGRSWSHFQKKFSVDPNKPPIQL